MFRAILYLIGIVLAINVVRSVLSIISKASGGVFGPSATPARPQPPTGATAGQLKKDPVCGTFISTATALQETVHGETYYFCSRQCRDQFHSVGEKA